MVNTAHQTMLMQFPDVAVVAIALSALYQALHHKDLYVFRHWHRCGTNEVILNEISLRLKLYICFDAEA